MHPKILINYVKVAYKRREEEKTFARAELYGNIFSNTILHSRFLLNNAEQGSYESKLNDFITNFGKPVQPQKPQKTDKETIEHLREKLVKAENYRRNKEGNK